MEKTKQNTGGVCEKTEARLDTGRALLYNNYYMSNHFAGVAELADAPDLGSGGLSMQVQVLSPAPKKYSRNRKEPAFLQDCF